MLLSIIVPIYNAFPYLEGCLNSILNNNEADYEIIAIDDCSTDGSWNLLKEYGQSYEQISIYRNNMNCGVSYSRNLGIQYAKGEYVWFVDSDDLICSDAIKKVSRVLKLHRYDAVFFDFIEENNGKKWSSYNRCVSDHSFYDNEYELGKDFFFHELLKEKKGIYRPSVVWNAVWKLGVIKEKEICFEEKTYLEDVLFKFQFLMKAAKVSEMTERLYTYRRRDGSITSSITDINRHSAFHVLLKILCYWKDVQNKFTQEENELMNYYCKRLYRTFEKYGGMIEKEQEYDMGSYAERFAYHMVNHDIYSFASFDVEIWKKIDDAQNIWIYGAGAVGVEVSNYMMRNGRGYCGFLVSSSGMNQEVINNHPVRAIEDISLSDRDAVIVGVSDRHRNDVLKQLSRVGAQIVVLSIL